MTQQELLRAARDLRTNLEKQEESKRRSALYLPLWQKTSKDEASFENGPLRWMTQHTRTEDPQWQTRPGGVPVAPFPAKEYFEVLLRLILEHPTMFIAKSREMMTSWLCCGYITWACLTKPHIFWLIQATNEEKAIHLVNYCRILYRNSDEWIRDRIHLQTDNKRELAWENGSRIVGIPSGPTQIRAYHPYGYFMDEAAFLPETEACFNVARPVAKRILAVSTDGLGWFHDMTKPEGGWQF